MGAQFTLSVASDEVSDKECDKVWEKDGGSALTRRCYEFRTKVATKIAKKCSIKCRTKVATKFFRRGATRGWIWDWAWAQG